MNVKPVLYSIIESPMHPACSGMYQRLGITELRFTSMRKALARLKTQAPDFVVAEFFYGYGNNYAGVNISNLDVLLSSLQKYSPAARVVVMVDKAEHHHVDKLNKILPLHSVLQHPVSARQIESLLTTQGTSDLHL